MAAKIKQSFIKQYLSVQNGSQVPTTSHQETAIIKVGEFRGIYAVYFLSTNNFDNSLVSMLLENRYSTHQNSLRQLPKLSIATAADKIAMTSKCLQQVNFILQRYKVHFRSHEISVLICKGCMYGSCIHLLQMKIKLANRFFDSLDLEGRKGYGFVALLGLLQGRQETALMKF